MTKPPILMVDGDARGTELAGRLRAHGFTVAEDAREWAHARSGVVLLVPTGASTEATCSRILRWYSSLPKADAEAAPCGRADLHRLVGPSAAMEEVRRSIARLASSDVSVLVTGETGTGKELVAELIHFRSGRSGRFVPINCAAIPDGLLESELFGYERGAFTGASGSYEGKLQMAAGGTVLLDEIGDMSAYAQAKLLRAIETREVYRLGGRRPVPLDIRIVAATNSRLDEAVAEGRFRKDLYFRLNVARIHLPPLRERPEDIPSLLQHTASLGASRAPGLSFSSDAVACLCRYPWPGNVRELRNVVEVMALSAAGGELTLADLPRDVVSGAGPEGTCPANGAEEERERLLAVLRKTHWNKSRAAEQLQWSRMTVYRKMAKYQIHVKP